ncbi:MAG TPA: M24 family metallopeptidase [Acidimicrobiales bacterium]|nr:M24 family metallopeptidase [Acidimicrobiales bacterium]
MTIEMLTPNIGTGAMEDRERVDYRSLRAERHDRVTALMDRLGLDALMLGREANVRYASGARRLWTASSRPFGPTAVLVRATGRVHLMTFSASYEGAPEEVPFEDVFCNSFNPGKLLEALLAIPGLGRAERIGVDGFSVFMRDFLPNAVPRANFVGVGHDLQLLRRDKLPAEVDAMRIAISIAESSLYAAAREVRHGASEKSLQAAYLDRMCALGTSQFAQQGTFSVITGDGSIRWITGESAVLAEGDAVVLAGGALWAGYEGSLARTWCSGPTTATHRDLHARWQHVIDALVAAARPGATGADLTAAHEAAGQPVPPMPIAYSLGLGHEGPLAGTALGPTFDRNQRIHAGNVLALRTHLRGGSGGYFGEEMVYVGADKTEVLTTLGHGV